MSAYWDARDDNAYKLLPLDLRTDVENNDINKFDCDLLLMPIYNNVNVHVLAFRRAAYNNKKQMASHIVKKYYSNSDEWKTALSNVALGLRLKYKNVPVENFHVWNYIRYDIVNKKSIAAIDKNLSLSLFRLMVLNKSKKLLYYYHYYIAGIPAFEHISNYIKKYSNRYNGG